MLAEITDRLAESLGPITQTAGEHLADNLPDVVAALASRIWRRIRLARHWDRKTEGYVDDHYTYDVEEIVAEATALVTCAVSTGTTLDYGVIMRATLDAFTQRKRPWNPSKQNEAYAWGVRQITPYTDTRSLLTAAHATPDAPADLIAKADELSMADYDLIDSITSGADVPAWHVAELARMTAEAAECRWLRAAIHSVDCFCDPMPQADQHEIARYRRSWE